MLHVPTPDPLRDAHRRRLHRRPGHDGTDAHRRRFERSRAVPARLLPAPPEPRAAAEPTPAPAQPAPAPAGDSSGGGPDFTRVAGQAVKGVANISSLQVVRTRNTPFPNDPFFRYFFTATMKCSAGAIAAR